MTLAFVVYFMLLFICTTFSGAYKSRDKKVRFVLGYLIPIVVVAIVFGGRFDVGSDWGNYKDYYDEISKYQLKDLLYVSLEPLYVLLNKVVAVCGSGSSGFFAIIAVFQFTVVYILFKKDRALVPYALFFYTLSNLSLDMNIVRQAFAMSLVFLASRYVIGKKNKIKCALLITAAIGFHYSAVICIPIIFVDSRNFKFLDKTSLVLVLYFITLIFATFINRYLSGYIQTIDFGDKYNQNASNLELKMVVSTGYGLIAKHLLNLTLIILWSKVRQFIEDPFYKIVYRITVLGFIFANIFGISVFLSRIALYYSQFQFILWTIISFYSFHHKKIKRYNLIVYGLIVLFLMMFAVSIYNGSGGISTYTFKWIS